MKPNEWQQIKKVFHAVMDLPETQGAAILEDCEAEVRVEVERLLRSHREASDFIVEPAVVEIGLAEPVQTDSNIGKRIDAYEIVEEIGQGGMGAVYLAVHADESFSQKVALKLIKRGMDTDAVLKRFIIERQILANLKHPNIAGLLDVGTTPDGLPYFVMEYIEGAPVTGFCRSHNFSIEERLNLFREICAAVSYAHQNLVVHRDLKPSNILVTKEGAPKLLDFGIAKLLNPDWSVDTRDATATMLRMMTPEYASPEQIRGLPITTASDVYSLGVILYELLSGQRPYRIEKQSREEFINAILVAEPIRPSSVVNSSGQGSVVGGQWRDSGAVSWKTGDRRQKTEIRSRETEENKYPTNPQSAIPNPKSLRGDLDNIILKALNKEPERRYPSVQELSEDIRRHLAGLPVTATADTRFYRLGKFIRRHRTGVLAGALMIIVILSAISITTWQAVVARREQAKTQQLFNRVRKLANTVLFEYHDGIADLPGSTPVREKMVKDALEYLDLLSAENIDDKELQFELATAYEKVGDVQGNPYLANLGDQDGALASYRKSLAIREALYVKDVSDMDAKLYLGNACNSLGDILWAKSEKEEALASYRRGLKLYEELAAAKPSINYNLGINWSLNGIGHVQTQMKDFSGALETYKKMLKIAESIAAVEPANREYRHTVGIAEVKVADALTETADYKGADEYYKKAVEMLTALLSTGENDAPVLRTLSLTYGNAAISYSRQSQHQNALDFNRKALTILRQLAAVDHGNIRTQFDIAGTLAGIGHNFLLLGKVDSAAASLEESIGIFKESLAKSPDYTQPRVLFGGAYVDLADILYRQGKIKESLENYQNALTVMEAEPVRSEAHEFLAAAYEGIGDIHQKSGRFEDAKTSYQKSLDVWNDLAAKNSLSPEAAGQPEALGQKIAKCEAALTR